MVATAALNKSDQAFVDLERLIVLQRLEPGTLVSEKQLMDLTGFGRTPVREAIQRLSRERLLEIHPNRGVLVAPSSVETQLKLLELRRNLEPYAVRLAASRATVAQREAASELARTAIESSNSIDNFAVFLRSAHALVVGATQNEYVEVAMAPLQGLSRRFWFAHMSDPEDDLAQAAGLHRDILSAIAHGDVDGATAASTALSDYLIAFAYGTLPKQD